MELKCWKWKLELMKAVDEGGERGLDGGRLESKEKDRGRGEGRRGWWLYKNAASLTLARSRSPLANIRSQSPSGSDAGSKWTHQLVILPDQERRV